MQEQCQGHDGGKQRHSSSKGSVGKLDSRSSPTNTVRYPRKDASSELSIERGRMPDLRPMSSEPTPQFMRAWRARKQGETKGLIGVSYQYFYLNADPSPSYGRFQCIIHQPQCAQFPHSSPRLRGRRGSRACPHLALVWLPHQAKFQEVWCGKH